MVKMTMDLTLFLSITVLAFIVGCVVGHLKYEFFDKVVIYFLTGILCLFLLLFAIPVGIAKFILFIKERIFKHVKSKH